MSRWNKIVLGTIVSVLVLSMGARALLGSSEPPPGPAPRSAQGSAVAPAGLVAGVPGQGESRAAEPAPEPGALETALPYVSEGSFFALIGFALGYASKKVVKLMLIFLAIFFVAIQALSFGGVLTVDWSRAVELLNNLILNLNENETVGQVLKDKLPTAGALGAGYWLGFRKG
jgi:uncharacterized membrane protein (Fun14 family)